MKLFSEKILLVPDTGFRLFFFPLGPDNFSDLGIAEKIEANRKTCTTLADGTLADFAKEGFCPWSGKVINYLSSSWTQVEEAPADAAPADAAPAAPAAPAGGQSPTERSE